MSPKPKSPRRQDLGLMVNLYPKPRLCPVGCRAMLGLYTDNGKENGNYRDCRGYMGIIVGNLVDDVMQKPYNSAMSEI